MYAFDTIIVEEVIELPIDVNQRGKRLLLSRELLESRKCSVNTRISMFKKI